MVLKNFHCINISSSTYISPQIVQSVTTQSSNDLIVPSLTAQLLSWTHYEKLLQVQDTEARDWYAKEAYEQAWSVRTLQRNISSQYYFQDACSTYNIANIIDVPTIETTELYRLTFLFR